LGIYQSMKALTLANSPAMSLVSKQLSKFTSEIQYTSKPLKDVLNMAHLVRTWGWVYSLESLYDTPSSLSTMEDSSRERRDQPQVRGLILKDCLTRFLMSHIGKIKRDHEFLFPFMNDWELLLKVIFPSAIAAHGKEIFFSWLASITVIGRDWTIYSFILWTVLDRSTCHIQRKSKLVLTNLFFNFTCKHIYILIEGVIEPLFVYFKTYSQHQLHPRLFLWLSAVKLKKEILKWDGTN